MKSGRVIFRHILCKNSLALGSFCSLAGALVLIKSAVCIPMIRALLLWSWEVLPASRNVSVCLSHGSQGLGGKVLCIRIFVSGSDLTKVNQILNKHQVLAGLRPSEQGKSYIAHKATDSHPLDAPLHITVQRSCESLQSRLTPMESLLNPPCPPTAETTAGSGMSPKLQIQSALGTYLLATPLYPEKQCAERFCKPLLENVQRGKYRRRERMSWHQAATNTHLGYLPLRTGCL